VHFGVGRYLYYLDGKWVKYDGQSKKLLETPQLPSWALPGQQATVPQDAPAVAADEHDDDASADNGNGHVAPPAIEPNAAMIIQDADKVKSALIDMAVVEGERRGNKGAVAASEEQRKFLARTLKEACGAVKEHDDRHAIYRYVFGADTLTVAQAGALFEFLVAKLPDGKYQTKTTAAAQVSTLYRAAQLAAGQRELAA
jgi:hypothetical protein